MWVKIKRSLIHYCCGQSRSNLRKIKLTCCQLKQSCVVRNKEKLDQQLFLNFSGFFFFGQGSCLLLHCHFLYHHTIQAGIGRRVEEQVLHSQFFSLSLPFPHIFPLLQHGFSMGHSSCQKPPPVWALCRLQFLRGMTICSNVGSSEGYRGISFFDLAVHRASFHIFFPHHCLDMLCSFLDVSAEARPAWLMGSSVC